MLNRDYALDATWRLPGTAEEVYDLLLDVEDLPRWWPANMLDVSVVAPGGAAGVGKTASFKTTGWLPIVQQWRAEVVEARRPEALRMRVSGDFEGEGDWRFYQVGDSVEVVFRWSVRIEKPVVRWLSALLKPVFVLDHNWAMARGLESLRLELMRRRSGGASAAATVPRPPQPAKAGLPLLLGAVGLTGMLLWALRSRG